MGVPQARGHVESVNDPAESVVRRPCRTLTRRAVHHERYGERLFSEVFLQYFLQLFAQLQTRPMQPTTHGADRQIEDFGDRLVAAPFHLTQYKDSSMLLAQCIDGHPDLPHLFFAQQLFAWGLPPHPRVRPPFAPGAGPSRPPTAAAAAG